MYVISDTYDTSEAFAAIHSQMGIIFEAFKDYINEGYALAQKKKIQLNEKLKIIEKEGFEETQIFLQQDYEPERIQNLLFEELFIHAGIGYLFSQLDNFLNRIASSTQDLFQSKNSFQDYSHKCKKFNTSIIKPLHYIKETFNVDLNSIDNMLQEIQSFKKIRNHLIHHNKSYLKDESLLRYIDENQNIEHAYSFINIKKDYLIDISTTIEKFLNSLMKSVYETHKKGKKYSS